MNRVKTRHMYFMDASANLVEHWPGKGLDITGREGNINQNNNSSSLQVC